MTIYVSEMLNVYTGVTIGGGGGLSWKVISVNTDAIGSNGYLVDTSGAQVTVTLPAAPNPGDQIGISDYNNNFETNNCILARNGNKIMGLSENFICDVNKTSFILVYADTAQGWKILYGV